MLKIWSIANCIGSNMTLENYIEPYLFKTKNNILHDCFAQDKKLFFILLEADNYFEQWHVTKNQRASKI